MTRTSAKNAEPGRQGAVQSKTGLADRCRSYWSHHRNSLIDSGKRLLATPAQTLMTSLVVAIALALPVTLLLALDNISELGASWDSNPKVSVYLNVRAKQQAIDQLLREIEAYPEVESLEFLSPQEALEDFQLFSGFGEALDTLEQNPLPPTIIVAPKMTAMEPHHLAALASRVRGEAIVEEVALDMDWVRRLHEIMMLGRKIVLVLATLLSIGVLLAIGNTIRLAIENRRDEILVIKLVGGTDGFVRRPFLYAGGWYGLLGGLFACVIIVIGYTVIEPSVLRLAALYQSDFLLRGLGVVAALQLLAISTALGWVGAWLAVGRHLRHVEPR